ncbi:hypothetical protein G5B10_07725 [Fluviicola sp. SGL-29]|nr:hypothetical protein [Fluviicola sp. SGL-29]
MKVNAELIKITEEMQSKELVDALNHNFQELKESSEQRDQALLNAIGRVEKDVASLKMDVSSLKYDVSRIIDHLSGKKLLTED